MVYMYTQYVYIINDNSTLTAYLSKYWLSYMLQDGQGNNVM